MSAISCPEAIGLKLKEEINAFRDSHVDEWDELVMKLIRKSRFEDPKLEIRRLRAEGILTNKIELKVDRAIQNYDQKKKIKSMVGQVLEIQNVYGSAYDVFSHAQSFRWLIYPDLLKQVVKEQQPKKDLKHFKFLRLPGQKSNEGIEKYAKDPFVHDHISREDLISADGYFYNNECSESALSFLNRNQNILDSFDSIQQCAKKALQTFYPSMEDAQAKDYARKAVEAGKQTNLGNLFVFCIPKQKSFQTQYRSHPYGRPCLCHRKKKARSILDQLQKGKLISETECCWGDSPQFRLFTPALTKENGVKIFLLPSDKKARKEEKLAIRSLVQEIHQKFSSTV